MRGATILLLLFIGGIIASEITDPKSKGKFELDYEEDYEQDFRPLLPDRDPTVSYFGAISTVQPKPTATYSLPHIIAYLIAGIAGLILFASLIIGIIAVVTTLSRTPAKYNDEIILHNGENTQPFLQNSMNENEIKINIDKKDE